MWQSVYSTWRITLEFFLLAIALCILHELSFLPDGKLHVHILDVGQGDSIFLISPKGKQLLIDGGEVPHALEKVAEHMSFFDRSLDIIILTHPDSDHLGILPELLERYGVQTVIFPNIVHSSSTYEKFLSLISSKEIPVIFADWQKDIDVGDGVVLDVLWPDTSEIVKFAGKPNNVSTVMRVTHNSRSILLTGDIEEDAENEILATGVILKSDVLKIAHHGSKTSTSTGFLLATNPELAVISSGKDNLFGHPHQEILNRLSTFAIPTRNTKDEGTISLEMSSK